MTIETNLNQSPFFDDFDENKNFHRVLFRPGYAVQARELTQLQTILQNQVERFANEVLVDGTIVTGVDFETTPITYVKLKDKDANNRVLLLSDFYEGGEIANAYVESTSSGLRADLISAEEGSEAAAPDYLSIFVEFTNSGSNNSTKTFGSDETLVIRKKNNDEFMVAANTIADEPTGFGLLASTGAGIIYHKGNFIKSSRQNKVVSKYNTTPSLKIGFSTIETHIHKNLIILQNHLLF